MTASDSVTEQMSHEDKTKSDTNPWFGAVAFGGGLAVVAVLALPLAVPAIAVGAGAVGLGAVASSTAISLGFVTTSAIAGVALGYHHGPDAIDSIGNFFNPNDKASGGVVNNTLPVKDGAMSSSSNAPAATASDGDATREEVTATPAFHENVTKEVVGASPANVREVEASIAKQLEVKAPAEFKYKDASPEKKEETLEFLKKLMEFRIKGVDKILEDKTKTNKSAEILSFLDRTSLEYQLKPGLKPEIFFKESDKEKIEKFISDDEDKKTGCLDINDEDIKTGCFSASRKKTNHQKELSDIREKNDNDNDNATLDDKLFKEFASIMTHSYKIKSLLGGKEDEGKEGEGKAVVDKAVVDKVKAFSQAFKDYKSHSGNNDSRDEIKKDVDNIKAIILKQTKPGEEVIKDALKYFEESERSRTKPPRTFFSFLSCFNLHLGTEINSDKKVEGDSALDKDTVLAQDGVVKSLNTKGPGPQVRQV